MNKMKAEADEQNKKNKQLNGEGIMIKEDKRIKKQLEKSKSLPAISNRPATDRTSTIAA
jgi:hypothetical protein